MGTQGRCGGPRRVLARVDGEWRVGRISRQRAEGSEAWGVWMNHLEFSESGTQMSRTGVCEMLSWKGGLIPSGWLWKRDKSVLFQRALGTQWRVFKSGKKWSDIHKVPFQNSLKRPNYRSEECLMSSKLEQRSWGIWRDVSSHIHELERWYFHHVGIFCPKNQPGHTKSSPFQSPKAASCLDNSWEEWWVNIFEDVL